ncbi:Uncharacterized protein TCM_025808 [Theobroma cacao]|uniref:Uncharacterized protein n=1 Tax=Theobroma cacao TaxID=3641 RepID=A0A061F060_THECC|nr:Uncharacterized protein TCM_025808 [Theobroma cacao]
MKFDSNGKVEDTMGIGFKIVPNLELKLGKKEAGMKSHICFPMGPAYVARAWSNQDKDLNAMDPALTVFALTPFLAQEAAF